MSEPAQTDPPSPGSSEPRDSRVSTASPSAERSSSDSGEARDTDLDAAFTPEPERTPVAGSKAPDSAQPPEHDTLLSAPKPADRLELVLEDKLASFEMRLDALEARVHALEHRKTPEPREASGRSWLWVFFLLALAVAWKALEALK